MLFGTAAVYGGRFERAPLMYSRAEAGACYGPRASVGDEPQVSHDYVNAHVPIKINDMF